MQDWNCYASGCLSRDSSFKNYTSLLFLKNEV